MQMRRFPGLTILAVLLGATVALAACAPFGAATPTAAPPPTMIAPPSSTTSATVVPTATVPAASATTAAPATALAPTVAATATPTNTAIPPVPTASVSVTTILAPSATVPPPPATALPATLVPIAPTPLAGATATDAEGRCAITLPGGFAATGSGAFSGSNGRATITLTPLAIGASDTLDDVAVPYVSTFMAAIGDYQQTAVARGEDTLRLDFTGRTTAPGRGTIFLRQFGGTVCALSFFIVQGTEIPYDQIVNALLASLRPAGAIGQAGTRERISQATT